MTSVIYAMGSLVIAANLRKETRMGWRTVLEALQGGAVNAVLVTASLACAGILMCTIGLTGVGLKFSSIVLDFSGGNILLALGLVAFASFGPEAAFRELLGTSGLRWRESRENKFGVAWYVFNGCHHKDHDT